MVERTSLARFLAALATAVFLVPTGARSQDLDFGFTDTYPMNGTVYSVEAADMNGDGASDLVAASFSGDNVAVFLNDGVGGLTDGVSYPVTNAVRSLVAADFNGDGNTDVVAASSIAEVFFLAGSGDGALGAPGGSTDPIYSGRAWDLAAADFDGDGNLDVAALTDRFLTIFAGDGEGAFTRTSVVTTGETTVQKAGLDVADFDGDGWVDVVAGNGDDQAAVALNDGTGTLSTPVFYPTPSSSAFDAEVADFNADGSPDIAVAGGFTSAVSVLLNDGTGTFGEPTTAAGDTPMWNIEAADLNGDRLPDLISAAGSSQIGVTTNNGDGSFSSARRFSFGFGTSYDVEAADLNGDDRLDLIATDAGSALEGFIGVRSNLTEPPPDFAWRTFGHDGQRTGRSEGPGPIVPQQAWQVDTSPLGFEFDHVIGSDGRIYSTYSGDLVARDASGATLWTFSSSIFGAPLLSADESTVFVSSRDVSLYAINASDGSVRWRYAGQTQWVEPMAEATDGTIYAIEASEAVAVDADGTEKWRYNAGDTISEILLSADGSVIVALRDGVLSLSASGSLNWSRTRSSWGGGGVVEQMASLPDGSLVVCTTFRLHRWTASGGDLFRVNQRCEQLALAADGTIATADRVVSTFSSDGARRWTANLGSITGASARIAYDSNNILYVASSDNTVRTYGPNGQHHWTLETPHEPRALAIGPGARLVYATYDATSRASALVAAEEAADPALLVADRRVIEFRSAAVGTQQTEMVTVENVGQSALAITNVALVGDDAAAFDVSPSSPQEISVGQQITVTVTYTPSEARAHLAELIMTTDGFAAERRIELIGDSAPAGLASSPWPHPAANTWLSNQSTVRAPGADAAITWETCLSDRDAFMTKTRPVVGPEGNLYVGFSGQVVALSGTGEELWRNRPGAEEMVVRSDGVVLLSTDALRAFSPGGNHLWTFFGDGISNTDGPVAVSSDGTIYYVSVDFGSETTLHALDYEGGEIWKVRLGSSGSGMDVGLLSSGEILVGGASAQWLVGEGGSIMWQRDLFARKPATGPDDTIYIAHSDGLDALNPATGETIWSNPNATRSPVSVAADGSIVVGESIFNTDGSLRTSALSGGAGAAISSDNTILTSNGFSMMFASNTSGDQLWSLEVPAISSNPPIMGRDGRIYVAGNGCVYAIDGAVTEPGITVDPPSLDFGSLTTGESLQRVLSLNNTGTGTLNVSAAEITGATPAEFSVVGPATPFDVESGVATDMTVAFTPSSPGGKSATLTLTHNAQGSPTEVTLEAVGLSGILPIVPSPDIASAEWGQEFLVDVNVGGEFAPAVDLYGIGLKLHYDADVLVLQSVSPGPLLQPSTEEGFIFFEETEPGVVSVSMTRMPPEESVDGSGTVASLAFHVLSGSPTTAAVFWLDDVLVTTASGEKIPAAVETARVQTTLGPIPRSAPELLDPGDGATGVSLDLTLKWGVQLQAEWFNLRLRRLPLVGKTADLDTVITRIVDNSISLDGLLEGQTTYGWSVQPANSLGEGPWSPEQSFTTAAAVSTHRDDRPTEFALGQNYPNPFNPTTTIRYDLPKRSDVDLALFDVLGRKVRVLASGSRPAGRHQVDLDASALPSGIYVYTLRADAFTQSRRMILVK